MKQIALALALTGSAFLALAAPAQADLASELAAGQAALGARKLADADAAFTRAVAEAPTDATANTWKALTRVLVLQTRPQANTVLDQLGVTRAGRNLFQWKAKAPKRITHPTLTTDHLENYGITFIRPELVNAEANLATVTDPAFQLTLATAQTGLPAVTLDYGDILFVRAFLAACICALDLADSQQTSVKISDVALRISSRTLSAEQLLARYPALLTQEPAPGGSGAFQNAAQAFQRAVDTYLQASEFIRARTVSAGRLIVIDPEFAGPEARLRGEFEKVRNSLAAPVAFDARTQVSGAAALTSAATLRSLLPAFEDNAPAAAGVADPTFGGVLPGLSKARADEFFTKLADELDDLTGFQRDPRIPVVRITSHRAGAKVIAAPGAPDRLLISGSALDRGGIARVEVDSTADKRIRAAVQPGPAGSAPGTFLWQATIDVVPGINDFAVQAHDSDGNLSPFARLRIDYVKNTQLTISQDGSGRVSRTSGAYRVGVPIAFSAAPAAGFILQSWTLDGRTVGNKPQVLVTLENLPAQTLVANFIPNPFPNRAGTYNVVFKQEEYDPDTFELISRSFEGLASIVLTRTGAFTAKIIYGGRTFVGRGAFDGSGFARLAFSMGRGRPPLTVSVWLSYEGEFQSLQVSLDDDRSISASAFVDAFILPVASRYNVRFDVDPAPALPVGVAPATLKGSSYATIVRDASGDFRLTGTMADGTGFSYGGRPLSSLYDDGSGSPFFATQLQIFIPLDSRGSRLAGELRFTGAIIPVEPPEAVEGELEWTWVRPLRGARFAASFATALRARGSVYIAPPAGAILPPLDASSGGSLLVTDGITPFLSEDFTLTSLNRATITGPNPRRASLVFNSLSGFFSGSFVTPAPGSVGRKFSGVLIPGNSEGAGFSLRLDASDSVTISP